MGLSEGQVYIVASNKSWHHDGFDSLAKEVPGDWFWVETQKELERIVNAENPRYVFFLHWSWIVPVWMIEKVECVCFHMTDLPYGRGGSPLQNLILRGHKNTKLTALRMDEGLDTGPIYAKRELSLQGRAQDIYIRAGKLSYELVRWIVREQPHPTEQVGEATLFKRRKPQESELPPHCSSQSLYDFIRMLDADGYPSAYLDYGDYRLILHDATIEDGQVAAKVVFRKKPQDVGEI